MNLNNLLIASSPMQIINGIEAIKHFDLSQTTLVLIYRHKRASHKRNNQQIEEIAKLHEWKEIVYLNKNANQNMFLDSLRVIKELAKTEYQYVFIGNFTKLNRILSANINKKHLYLVDDGTATIKTYNEIFLKNKINKLSLRHILYFLSGVKIKVTDKINLFTYFDLKENKQFNIVRNNLNYFKNSRKNESKSESPIIFLGQILSERHFVTVKDYKSYINSILAMHDEKIIYIPHRYEEINKTVLKLESEKLEIQEINLPVELYLIYNNIVPKKLISFCTSAFFVLDKIYPETTFEHIVIPEHKLLKDHDEIRKRYDSLTNETTSSAVNLEDS